MWAQPRTFEMVRGRGTQGLAEGTASGHESSETLEQVTQRSCGCSIPGNIQGNVGWGFEQPGQVKDAPAHGRGVGLDDL